MVERAVAKRGAASLEGQLITSRRPRTATASTQAAVHRLKDQERIVLTLYYFEELKLHEIADVLDLTESRVSQIRTKALGKLRVELAHFRTPA